MMIFYILLVLITLDSSLAGSKNLFPTEIKTCHPINVDELVCPRKYLDSQKSSLKEITGFSIKVVIKVPKTKIRGFICTGVYHVTSCSRNIFLSDTIHRWVETRDLDEGECSMENIDVDDTLYPDELCEWSSYKENRIKVTSIKEHIFHVNIHTGFIEDDVISGSCNQDRCKTDGLHHQIIATIPKLNFDDFTIENTAYLYSEESKIWLISDVLGKIPIDELRQSTFLNKHVYLTRDNCILECKDCFKFLDYKEDEEIKVISNPDFLESHLISEESKIWEKLCELTLPIINMTKSISHAQLDLFRPRMPGVFNFIISHPESQEKPDSLQICQAKWDYSSDLNKDILEDLRSIDDSLYHTNIGTFIKGKLITNWKKEISYNSKVYDGKKELTKISPYEKYKKATLSKSKILLKQTHAAASIKSGILSILSTPLNFITNQILWIFSSVLAAFLFLYFLKVLISNQGYKKVNNRDITCHL